MSLHRTEIDPVTGAAHRVHNLLPLSFALCQTGGRERSDLHPWHLPAKNCRVHSGCTCSSPLVSEQPLQQIPRVQGRPSLAARLPPL